jgi:RecB family exonuclease
MARQRITVTQLKCAVLDPEWRMRWLAGGSPSTFVFNPNATSAVYGARFHQETERLTKWLISSANLRRAAAIRSADELLDVAWGASLQSFTDELFANGSADDAASFTARMRHFCERLMVLRSRTAAFENWQDVFVAAEESIDCITVPVGENAIEIGARVDAIRFHPQHHLEVVDYKLSQGVQQKSDLIQLAIYTHIIPLRRNGCRLCGTLEYYLPSFMEVNVSIPELADIYASMVEPVLHEMFACR